MKIDDLQKIDFTSHWLTCSRTGEINVQPKDPFWLRWLKTAFQVLTFCVFDVYGHVKIKRVAEGLFAHLKKDFETDRSCRKKYVLIVDTLLQLSKKPIKTDRRALVEIKGKMLALQQG